MYRWDGKAFGLRLKEARELRGLTLADVAEKFGRTKQAVGHWESGTNTPNVDVVVKLARLYGADVTWLILGQQVEPAADVALRATDPEWMLAVEFARLPRNFADGGSKQRFFGQLLSWIRSRNLGGEPSVSWPHQQETPTPEPEGGPGKPRGKGPSRS